MAIDDIRPTDRAESDSLLTYVLSRWRLRLRRVTDTQPRSDERGEIERLLVTNLLRVIEEDDEANLLPALAAAAAQYGASQRRQRIDPGALCEEFSALRMIVWDVVKAKYQGIHQQSVVRILRFDRALSIVIRAALKAGYNMKDIQTKCHSAPVDRGSDE